jgi:hypothetical protein
MKSRRAAPKKTSLLIIEAKNPGARHVVFVGLALFVSPGAICVGLGPNETTQASSYIFDLVNIALLALFFAPETLKMYMRALRARINFPDGIKS